MADSEEFLTESCLSFPVNVRSLPPKGLALTLQTNEKERAALARVHGLLAVRSFAAALQLRPWQKRGVELSGQIDAVIEQQCVITAEPVENTVQKRFEAYFVPQESRLAKPRSRQAEHETVELLLDPEGEDAPEIFSGGILDAGAVAEEFFELAIDPYPRQAGAVLPAGVSLPAGQKNAGKNEESAAAEKPVSPFAALKALKKD